MTATAWPPRPGPRVRHGWRCRRVGPYHDELRELPNARTLAVTVCEACGSSDLVERIRAEAAERGAT